MPDCFHWHVKIFLTQRFALVKVSLINQERASNLAMLASQSVSSSGRNPARSLEEKE